MPSLDHRPFRAALLPSSSSLVPQASVPDPSSVWDASRAASRNAAVAAGHTPQPSSIVGGASCADSCKASPVVGRPVKLRRVDGPSLPSWTSVSQSIPVTNPVPQPAAAPGSLATLYFKELCTEHEIVQRFRRRRKSATIGGGEGGVLSPGPSPQTWPVYQRTTKRVVRVSGKQSGVPGVKWNHSSGGRWEVNWNEEKMRKHKYFTVHHFMNTGKTYSEAEADACSPCSD